MIEIKPIYNLCWICGKELVKLIELKKEIEELKKEIQYWKSQTDYILRKYNKNVRQKTF